MRSDLAETIILASMSDADVFNAYMAAKKQNDPRVKRLGIELVQRLHQIDPKHFTKDMVETTIKALEEKYP